MARDYKNSGRRRRRRSGMPGWLLLATGFGLGLLAALAIGLQDVRLPRPAFERAATPAPAPAPPVPAARPAKAEQELQFEFYTLLPESEVVIPEQELVPPTQSGAAPERPPGNYMLQAGSFRQQQQAEALKGELALVGIVAHVQRVDVNGDTWFRVRVGPFASYEEITRARDRLQDNDINAIAVKVKG